MNQETKSFEPGIYDLTDVEYHAAPGISSSGLALLARSPAHYYAERLDPNREPEVVTPAKLEGRAIHTAVLEPHLFRKSYAVIPPDAPRKPTSAQVNAKKPSPASVAAIEWWGQFNLANRGKHLLTTEQADKYQLIASRIRNHPELSVLLEGADIEQSIFANDPETGALCRIRTDIRNNVGDHQITVDLKSTEDARPEPFKRSAYNYGYFTQASFYTDVQAWSGLPPSEVYLILAYEKSPPYASMLYEVEPAELDRAREEYRESLNRYAECFEKKEWPAYPSLIQPLHYPAWARRQS